jgi:hypothetical protein
MAEVQTTTESGEMTQRFIEFVMMQQQNTALFLGLIPNPQTGKGEVNLDVAKMFIDQLVMIRAKTRGNLTEEELKILNGAISNLQMAFVDVMKHQGQAPGVVEPPSAAADEPPAGEPAAAPAAAPVAEGDAKKKFTKSYGA